MNKGGRQFTSLIKTRTDKYYWKAFLKQKKISLAAYKFRNKPNLQAPPLKSVSYVLFLKIWCLTQQGLSFFLCLSLSLFLSLVIFQEIQYNLTQYLRCTETAYTECRRTYKCVALMLRKSTLKTELIKLEWPPKAKLHHKA